MKHFARTFGWNGYVTILALYYRINITCQKEKKFVVEMSLRGLIGLILW